MNNNLYTTGTVTGLTRLSRWAVHGYIETFGEFFSEGTKRPRGRRYTNKDVQLLIFIRQMKAAHKGNTAIRAALSGPIELPYFDIPEAMQIVGQAIQINSASNQAVKKADNATQNAIYTVQRGDYMLKRFSQALEHFEQIPQLESNLRVMKSEFDKLSLEVAQLTVNAFIRSSDSTSKTPLVTSERLRILAWALFILGLVGVAIIMVVLGVRAWGSKFW